MAIIIGAGERARDLIRQIPAVSRKQGLVKQKVDLAGLTRDALQMLCASLPSTIQIVVQISEVAPVFADAGALHQIVVNLVTNAAQAIGDGFGEITVTVGEASSWASSPQQEKSSRYSPSGPKWLSIAASSSTRISKQAFPESGPPATLPGGPTG